jgi:hypothetical protein
MRSYVPAGLTTAIPVVWDVKQSVNGKNRYRSFGSTSYFSFQEAGDGGNRLSRNVGNDQPKYTASHPRRQ